MQQVVELRSLSLLYIVVSLRCTVYKVVFNELKDCINRYLLFQARYKLFFIYNFWNRYTINKKTVTSTNVLHCNAQILDEKCDRDCIKMICNRNLLVLLIEHFNEFLLRRIKLIFITTIDYIKEK